MNRPSGTVLARATLARLREEIASGRWPVGSRIPTEPELARTLGVGRSTVREAVRSLATLGMVETKRAHGTYVTSATPAPELLVNALSVYLPAQLVGLRRALDVEAAQAAAANWTADDLEALEAVIADEAKQARQAAMIEGSGVDGTDDAARLRPDACGAFHAVIARASGNRLLADLDATLAAEFRASGLADQIAIAQEPAARLQDHERILTAIRGRDPGTVAHLMAVHVDAALRGLLHEPIITELTSLVPRSAVRGRRRRGAA